MVEEEDLSEPQVSLRVPGTRSVILPDDIDDLVVIDLTKHLIQLANESKEPVELLISSNGGDALSSIAIIDLLSRLRGRYGVDIDGVVLGQALSGAAFILQACTMRQMYSNAVLMIHGPTSALTVDTRSLEAETKLVGKMRTSFSRLLCKRTKQLLNYWEAILKDNTPEYYSADEALAAGLIDVVL